MTDARESCSFPRSTDCSRRISWCWLLGLALSMAVRSTYSVALSCAVDCAVYCASYFCNITGVLSLFQIVYVCDIK